MDASRGRTLGRAELRLGGRSEQWYSDAGKRFLVPSREVFVPGLRRCQVELNLRKKILIRRVLTFALAMMSASPALGADGYKVLHEFGASLDGSVPSGPLLLDGKGWLYGNTYDGGTGKCSDYGCGITFGLQPQAHGEWKEVVLHEFTGGKDGAAPFGNVVADKSGNLYSTMSGAVIGQGAVFELSPGDGKWALSLVYGPYFGPGLVLDNAGNLYGSLGRGDLGAGAIGELSPGTNGWTYTQLYSFCSPKGGCPDGDVSYFALSWDAHGNLYGTTLQGGNVPPKCPGSAGCGVAFQMTPNPDGSWSYHVMHRFANSPTDGQYPDGGLVVDSSGNAYGVAGEGGVNKQGTVFKMTPAPGGHWKQTVLYDFPDCAEGCFPDQTLVFDKQGNLYGVSSGGLQDCGYTCGVVFKLTPQKNGAWTYSVLHKFTGKDGAFPWGLTIDDKGSLFGATESGGTYNRGVAFEITP